MTQKCSVRREPPGSQELADTRYPVENVLRRRRSPLAFAARPVEVEKLQQLFEAARWAPSSFNEQPWSFFLTTRNESPEDYERLASCLTRHNRDWALRAPVLVLSTAKRHFEHGGRVNEHSAHDVGLATENLIIHATAVELFVHAMAGFDGGKARELFAIPDSHYPVCVFAIGYFGDVESLPAELQRRELAPRQRRPFRDFVFSGRWGEPTTLIPD